MCEENLLGNTSCRIYGLRKEIGLCNGSQPGTYYMVEFMHLLRFQILIKDLCRNEKKSEKGSD